MRITARQQPSESGLARVCQSPRGYIIKVDGKDVGRVGWGQRSWSRGDGFWFFYASLGERSRNSSAKNETFATREAARDACIAWLRATQAPSPAAGNASKGDE